ncbi:MAG TPA: L-arabinose isomerase [Gaiellaceae bacterium]
MSVKPLGERELWLVVGSQELYGEETLRQVGEHAGQLADALDGVDEIPVRVVAKPVVTSADAIRRLCLDANADDACVGIVAWMHTFSPARMWIPGLTALQKPLLHLHTQFNRELPWGEIDMDFMNLNQSAHGDRELGYMQTRLGRRRKTVAGHWQDPAVHARIGVWARAACGWAEAKALSVARFGDNMRQVAVTDGDKVEAEIRFGFSVNGYGVGDLAALLPAADATVVVQLLADYDERYRLADELRDGGDRRSSLVEAARIEAALRAFLDEHGCSAFTDTFEDLHGLAQLPGIAAQRLMADGYGFGAEGDWKAAALVRIVKVMTAGLPGGTSFMEDYTYHLDAGSELVLGAHMLEICPSIAAGQPSCEIHPLSIGGAADPVRLVFDAAAGPAVVVSLVDLGDRFRFVANEVDVIAPPQELPRLPVARAVWRARPDFTTAVEGWLAAGGSHHTVFTAALGLEAFADFATIAGVELVEIGEGTTLRELERELRWNEAGYR